MARQIVIGTFIHGLGLGHWRDPEVPADAPVNIDYITSIAQQAEAGLLDLAFVADVPHTMLHSAWKLITRIEPLVTLGAVSARTERIGLAGTVSTSYTQPYDVARLIGTLDTISKGRAGWNVVTSGSAGVGRNYSAPQLHDHGTRYEIADEYLDVVTGLWDSWDEDAFTRDKSTGEYHDPAKGRILGHDGKYFQVEGPLNLERSPQGKPVVFVAGASAAGKALAAKHADAVFANQPESLEEGQREYREWKRLTAEAGRDPASLKVLPSFQPIVGRTTEEAEQRYRETIEYFDTEHALTNLSWYFDYYDFTQLDPDGPLPEDILDHAKDAFRSTATRLVEISRAEGLTLHETALRGVHPPRDFVGSAVDVADRIQHYFENEVWDGVILTTSPRNLQNFIDLVVPILQERGIFRTGYTTTTLRGHLGLS